MHKNKPLRAFTLLEVLITIAISSVLFLAVSNLMISFYHLNTEIKKDLSLNDQKEIAYLTIQNFLDEAERIEYADTSLSEEHKIIVRNKKESSLLPFTAMQIITEGNSKKLKIYNFALSNDGTSTPLSSYPPITDIAGYTINHETNQIIKGSSSTDYCNPPTITNNCILVGYKQNKLVYGKTAFAPFISITKPTDMMIKENTDCSGNATAGVDHLCILSPYEKREYHINLTTLEIQTTSPAGQTFPYYYDASNNIVSPQFNNAIFSSLTNPVSQFSYNVIKLQLVNDVYSTGSGSSLYTIKQLIFTLQDSKDSTKETTFSLFKTLRR